jgi:uncharacterized membrane protein YtjA (UPF0391 family)
MIGWAIFFLLVALAAAVLGFSGIANLSVNLAVIVFVVALILAVLSGIFGLFRRPPR